MRPDTNHATKLAYSVEEACKASSLGRTTLYSHMAAGRLHSVRIGGRRLIQAEVCAHSSMAKAKGQPMSVQVIKLVWRVKGQPPGQKLLLAALADHADPSGICWPFMGTLADETGLHIRTVERLTEALVKAGHLSRARIGRKG